MTQNKKGKQNREQRDMDATARRTEADMTRMEGDGEGQRDPITQWHMDG